jgi:hypothetical protein
MVGNVKQDIQPIRELRVIAYLDGRTVEDVQSIIKGTNEELAQFGIRLTLVDSKKVHFKFGWDANKILRQVEKWSENRKDFDLGIAFTKPSTFETVAEIALFLLGGVVITPDGATETFWGRYIVVYSGSPTVLFHEVCHCFLYDDMPIGLSIMHIGLTGGTLSREQQVNLMKNKWRDFSVSPVMLATEKMPQQDWVQLHFPDWKQKYPEQFGLGTEYDSNLKRNRERGK